VYWVYWFRSHILHGTYDLKKLSLRFFFVTRRRSYIFQLPIEVVVWISV